MTMRWFLIKIRDKFFMQKKKKNCFDNEEILFGKRYLEQKGNLGVKL